MLKTIFAASLSVSLLTASAQAEVINVNLFTPLAGSGGNPNQKMDGTPSGAGAPAAYTGTKWNDFGFVGTIFNVENSDGVATNVDITSAGSGNAWALNGPLTALNNYLWAIGSFTITELDPNSKWDLYVLTQDLNPTTATFTVNGTTQSSTTPMPTSTSTWVQDGNYVLFETVDAGASGQIVINRDAGPINGFQLVLIPEPASLALMGLGGLMILRRRA